MSQSIDVYIDSDSFHEEEFLQRLEDGEKPTAATLIIYLSKGVVYPLSNHQPQVKTVEKLLSSGAKPYLFDSSYKWDLHFYQNIRIHMPKILRSTLNVAALLGNEEIMQMLLNSGEIPNLYTTNFANSSAIKE